MSVSLHRGSTRPIEQELHTHTLSYILKSRTSLSHLVVTYDKKECKMNKCSDTHSPVWGAEVHAQHYTLLCVLPSISGHYNHVACALRVHAFQPHRLPDTTMSINPFALIEAFLKTIMKPQLNGNLNCCLNVFLHHSPDGCCPLAGAEWTWSAGAAEDHLIVNKEQTNCSAMMYTIPADTISSVILGCHAKLISDTCMLATLSCDPWGADGRWGGAISPWEEERSTFYC